ncbi:MAG: lysophospholipid acyltransferase family protein [Candidatus Binatia bacterium]
MARLLFSGLALLPRPLAIRAGRALAHIAYLVNWKLRRIGERNLELAFPEMGQRERSRLLRGSIVNLGRHLGEFSRCSRVTPETLRKTIDCEGLDNLDAARALGRGVIMFTGHLGAWEMISLTLSAFGYPFNFLVRRIKNPAIERLIENTRTRFGNRTIDKRSAARAMLTTLRRGGMLGLLVDINVMRDKGIFVDFFGVPASTTFMAAKLALRTGAAVVPVFAPWEDRRQRFVMYIGAPLTIDRSGDEEEDIRQLTSRFTKTVEDYIRRYPDQWLWIHKRWRTRPPGEQNFYESATSHARPR